MSQTGADLSLGQLGTGKRDDRLHSRLIIRLLVRCLHLLRPVRGHLALLFLGFSALALIFVPVGILLMDTCWTRVLQGGALTASQATLLRLDPAVFFEGGHTLERGPHPELMAKRDGAYRRFVELQTRGAA